MKLLKAAALLLISIYVFVILMAFAFQSRLIFHPGKLPADYQFMLGENDREVFLKTDDGESINALYYKGAGEYVILYFHGNAGDLSSWQGVAADFIGAGYSVFIPDYRGYGKSTGKISEQGLYEDAEACWKYLTDELEYRPDQIIFYGRSIGTGVAVELATRHKVRGLVLESAHAGLPRLASEMVPYLFPSLWLRFRFENERKINRITSPIMLIHGTADTLIPPGHSQRLFDRFTGSKKIILIEGGGHNDLPLFDEFSKIISADLNSFLNSANGSIK